MAVQVKQTTEIDDSIKEDLDVVALSAAERYIHLIPRQSQGGLSCYDLRDGGRTAIVDIEAEELASLRNYGFSNTKSKMMDIALIISNVPRYLYRHLIRGMFDGDGSITIYDYPYFKKHSYHLGYTG